MSAGTVRIGTIELPREGEVVVIAEAGVNHDGDPALAHRLVDVAADAGADAVKFQTFDPDRLVSAAADASACSSRSVNRARLARPVSESWNAWSRSSSSSRFREVMSR